MIMEPQVRPHNRAVPDYHLDQLTELAPALTTGQRDRLAALARLTRPTPEQRRQEAARRREQRQRQAARRRQQVIKLCRQGMTRRAIAAALGCSVDAVAADLRAAAASGDLPAAALARVKTPEQKRQHRAMEQRQQQSAALRRRGMTYKAIGRILGVSATTVYYDLLAAEAGAGAGDHDAA
jgi:DNA-binding CsgD family transcriptional regulator